jgi:hypothetical protein
MQEVQILRSRQGKEGRVPKGIRLLHVRPGVDEAADLVRGHRAPVALIHPP